MNVRHASIRKWELSKSVLGALSRNSHHNITQFQDLGLSGLTYACNPNVTHVRKLVWGLLWLLACIWCIIECTNCVVEFVSTPFTVNVKHQRNHSITAPYVTLCPTEPQYRNPTVSPVLLEKHYGNRSYSNAVELLLKYKMSIEELWNISRFEVEHFRYSLYEVMEWLEGDKSFPKDKVFMRELLTIHGICLTFTMNWPLSCMGMQNGINIKGYALTKDGNASSKYYTGIIHSGTEIPFIRYTGTFSTGFYTVYKQLTSVALRVQQIVHVNTWKNPCQSEDRFLNCMITCIEKRIIENSKLPPCRLPYMVDMVTLPHCVSAEEFSNMFKATQTGTKYATPDNCSCIQPCSKVTYKEDYYLTSPVEYLFGIYVMIPSCDIEVIEESLIYGFTSFLAEIGVSLGLFLGMSVLSILEIVEVMMMKAFRR